jgi:hypothetical protein
VTGTTDSHPRGRRRGRARATWCTGRSGSRPPWSCARASIAWPAGAGRPASGVGNERREVRRSLPMLAWRRERRERAPWTRRPRSSFGCRRAWASREDGTSGRGALLVARRIRGRTMLGRASKMGVGGCQERVWAWAETALLLPISLLSARSPARPDAVGLVRGRAEASRRRPVSSLQRQPPILISWTACS